MHTFSAWSEAMVTQWWQYGDILFFFFFLLSRCAVTPPWSSSEQGSRVMSITVGGIWRACTTLWWSRHETSCRYRLVGALSLSTTLLAHTAYLANRTPPSLLQKPDPYSSPSLSVIQWQAGAFIFWYSSAGSYSVRVFGRWSYFSLLLLNLKPRGDWLGLKMK